MSNPNQICFTPEPGDSIFFGSSVAINDKYLVMGDSRANYVIIYTRDNSGQWVRTKKIFPPKNSTPYKYGRGFGSSVQLDGDVLVVGAFTQQRTRDVINPEDFQLRGHYMSNFYGRYLTRLNSEIEIKAVDLPIERKSGFVQFNLLFEGKIKSITLTDQGEDRFGESFSLHNNLLLVGSPSDYDAGGAWLFDINNLDNEPLKITDSKIATGETVAISEKFVALGYDGILKHRQYFGRRVPQKTLIRNINTGSTTIIDGVGILSLSGNILARMLPKSRDTGQNPLLEVFRLDDNTEPNLILKRTDLSNGWGTVENGFLITNFTNYNAEIFKVCIEPLNSIQQ